MIPIRVALEGFMSYREKAEELVKKYAVLASSPTRTVEESAERALRDEIRKEMPLPTMEEFLSTRRESLDDEDPDRNV